MPWRAPRGRAELRRARVWTLTHARHGCRRRNTPNPRAKILENADLRVRVPRLPAPREPAGPKPLDDLGARVSALRLHGADTADVALRHRQIGGGAPGVARRRRRH